MGECLNRDGANLVRAGKAVFIKSNHNLRKQERASGIRSNRQPSAVGVEALRKYEEKDGAKMVTVRVDTKPAEAIS
jgi:hypothetical protein